MSVRDGYWRMGELPSEYMPTDSELREIMQVLAPISRIRKKYARMILRGITVAPGFRAYASAYLRDRDGKPGVEIDFRRSSGKWQPVGETPTFMGVVLGKGVSYELAEEVLQTAEHCSAVDRRYRLEAIYTVDEALSRGLLPYAVITGTRTTTYDGSDSDYTLYGEMPAKSGHFQQILLRRTHTKGCLMVATAFTGVRLVGP
jgi:hypothetical protein